MSIDGAEERRPVVALMDEAVTTLRELWRRQPGSKYRTIIPTVPRMQITLLEDGKKTEYEFLE